jgi:hypothetical protein
MRQPEDLQQLTAAHGALLRLDQDTRDPAGRRAYRWLIKGARTRPKVVRYLTKKWGCEDCARAFTADVALLQRLGTPPGKLDVRQLVPAANLYVIHAHGEEELIKCYIPQALDPTGMRRTSRAVTWYSELGGGSWLNLPYGDNWLTAAEKLHHELKQRYGNPARHGKVRIKFSFVPSPLQTASGESAWEVTT